MIFRETLAIEELGETLGYVFSYLLFTLILYLIFLLLEKIPESWSYFHMMGITLIIAVIGILLKRALR